MKRTLLVALTCALAAAVTTLIVDNAASQPRISTTRQLLPIGAAAGQTHGAWFVDLQAGSIIFCERAASGVQCQTAVIP